ncbi:MAG TPA: DNA polymerase IV [Burkholderiaceae bacterium]|nr:DNA polymerase IV [Burkholderiaceae bacterium]
MDSPRLIAHLDMDAFYASVELLRYPDLRGRPVVIGGGGKRRHATLRGYAGRGVITTATYEARALGVHSGMGLMKAAQLAPDAILLPADFDEYRRYSRAFKAAVQTLAPCIEDRGIDEIYIDLSDSTIDPARAWSVARDRAVAIKRAVRDATGLSCSIGLAPNKLLAKIASDLDKPDGLTVITPESIIERIHPLPVGRINGVGPKANAKLEDLGIRTIGELAQCDRYWLMERFGQGVGAWLHDAAHGRDDRPVVTHREPKSMSRETTFERDLHAVRDRDALSRHFTDLCERVAHDLQRKGFVGKTIGLKLRYDDFRTVTRDHTIETPTDDATTIRKAAGVCLKRVPLDRRIRLLGVRVGALSAASAHALPSEANSPMRSLFD